VPTSVPLGPPPPLAIGGAEFTADDDSARLSKVAAVQVSSFCAGCVRASLSPRPHVDLPFVLGNMPGIPRGEARGHFFIEGLYTAASQRRRSRALSGETGRCSAAAWGLWSADPFG
jgi:hypothetical protein